MVTPPLVVLTSRPEPVPAVPVEVDVQAAVGRVSFDVATCATKVHATVERVETDAPPHVADRDAAVVGLEIQVRVVRHHDLPAHATALSPARVGALGAQAATVGRDTYGAHELLRPRLTAGVRLGFGAHLDDVAAPSLDARPTVEAAIDGEPTGISQLCRERYTDAILVSPAPLARSAASLRCQTCASAVATPPTTIAANASIH